MQIVLKKTSPLSFLVPFLIVLALSFPNNVNAQTADENTVDVKTGLKEAGISTLPTFLDAATESITIKFPKALGGGKLKFGGTVDADALQEKQFVFETSEEGKLKWDNAFGLSFIDLKDTALNLSFAKGEYKISLDGMVSGAFGNKPTPVIIDLQITDKEVTDFTFSAPDSTLKLSSVPEMKKIPGGKTFAISKPTVSKNSLVAKSPSRNRSLMLSYLETMNPRPGRWLIDWTNHYDLVI